MSADHEYSHTYMLKFWNCSKVKSLRGVVSRVEARWMYAGRFFDRA